MPKVPKLVVSLEFGHTFSPLSSSHPLPPPFSWSLLSFFAIIMINLMLFVIAIVMSIIHVISLHIFK